MSNTQDSIIIFINELRLQLGNNCRVEKIDNEEYRISTDVNGYEYAINCIIDNHDPKQLATDIANRFKRSQ